MAAKVRLKKQFPAPYVSILGRSWHIEEQEFMRRKTMQAILLASCLVLTMAFGPGMAGETALRREHFILL